MNAFVGRPTELPRRGTLWPVMLLALLGGQMAFVLIVAYVASSDRSVGIEPQYYEKALKWDDQARQEQTNRDLGWHIAVQVSDPFGKSHERRLSCRLQDRVGWPLADAAVEVTAFHNARSNDRLTITLTESGNGDYFADVPFQRDGFWELRFTARRGADLFTSVQQQKIAAGPGASR